MAQGLRLEPRQSQRLAMTPQLQQAIRLLQMSNLDLAAHLAQEVERNPLLALDDGAAERAAAAPPPDPLAAPLDRWAAAEGGATLGAEVFDTGAENTAAENLHDGAGRGAPDAVPGEGASWAAVGAGGNRDFRAPAADLEAEPAPPLSLRAHLLAQLGQMRARPVVAAIARAIVEELDEAGYLRADPAELGGQLRAAPADLEAALALVQTCAPTGVGARSVAECLRLQLAERDRLDPAMAALVDNLELVVRGERRRLRALCGVGDADLDAMLAELRRLDPRPGAAFAGELAAIRVPDVLLRRGPGGWEIELNPETLPRLLIDRHYAARLAPRGSSARPEARRFLAEARASAHWLARSLDQRARTILAVAAEIVRRQQGFLDEGVAALKPLTLRMVAEATGLHESTVSRVTANKAIATPRGVLDLRFFFTNAVGEDGPAAEAVRHRIRALVAVERPGAVLSDDAIVERLQEDGIVIARRTVAKYRKALGIPSSAERRCRGTALTPG